MSGRLERRFADLCSAWPEDLVTLQAGDSLALIAPTTGANCIAFGVGTRNIMESPHRPDELVSVPARAGCPVLFPLTGRLREGKYRFDGEERRMPLNGPGGAFHQHGLVSRRRWRLTDRGVGSCTCVFDQSLLEPEERESYPWPFALILRWSITPGCLRADVRVENPGLRDLPFGFGLHPYLLAPLDAAVDAPATLRWPTEANTLVGAPQPALGPWSAQVLQPDTTIFLTGLPTDTVNARVVDLVVRFPGDRFSQLVLYRPPGRPSVCLEPWTTAPGAAALIDAGRRHGLLRLQPATAWSAWMEIALGQ